MDFARKGQVFSQKPLGDYRISTRVKLTREQLISNRRPVTITKHPLPHIYEMRKATFVPTL